MNKLNESNWRDINWASSDKNVRKWQDKIYSASKVGEVKEVRRFQHAILGLMDSKLIAVRQITQDNKGRKTPGVDKVGFIPPDERIELARSLRIYTPGSPLRRIWIPKPGTNEKRPLSIPTIKDRCLQALFKMALEPEWEAKFENDSYFRKGRSCHDAIAAVRGHLLKEGDKYILDADISKCFDRIDHEYLLKKLGFKGMYRKQIKSWLKCGVIDQNVFGNTEEGTPQGGVISPLLANIALDGMERFCRDLISKTPSYTSRGTAIKSTRRGTSLGIIRYADDFVFIHPQLDTILFLEKELEKFLSPIGLQLSERKTQITHYLNFPQNSQGPHSTFSNKPGFNFLGFNFRQYPTIHRTMKDTSGKKLGFRLLILPTKANQLEHQAKLHKIILKEGKKKGLTQEGLILRLNPVISGWSRYFGLSDANTMGILGKMDYLTYLKLRRWSSRIYGGAGKGKVTFSRIGTKKWVFSTKEIALVQHIDYSKSLGDYIKIKGASSPFDGNIKYWSGRLEKKYSSNKRISYLLRLQKGNCKLCHSKFHEDDIMEIDHITPTALGGSNHNSNFQLLHGHCHQLKSATDGSRMGNQSRSKIKLLPSSS